MLPPKEFDCLVNNTNETNIAVSRNVTSVINLSNASLKNVSRKAEGADPMKTGQSKYPYSREYGRSVLTDVSENLNHSLPISTTSSSINFVNHS